MAYKREFIVDKIYVIDEYHDFVKAIAQVEAYWKITNDEYPKGFRNYDLSKALPVHNISRENWVAIDKVTNANLEEWLTVGMTTQDKIDIELDSQAEIMRTNLMDSWVVHYDRNA